MSTVTYNIAGDFGVNLNFCKFTCGGERNASRSETQNAFVRILSESKLQRVQPGSQLYLQLQIH